MPHPSVPRRDNEGACKQDGEHPSIALTRPKLGGLDAWLHLLEMRQTQTYAKYVRMAPPRPAEILLTPAETNTSHTGRLCEKTLQEHPRSCKASGATPAGALVRPHGTAQHLGGRTFH
jgi:hypothetical protein